MKSKVYYTNLRTKPGMSLLKKLRNLAKAAGIEKIDFDGKFTAVKLHFGEPGNMAYIRPNYVATVVDLLNSLGAKTFLTDSNTLYKGKRDNAVDHLHSAMINGFNPIQVNCNVIIADGLKGTNYAAIPIEGAKYCPAPKIGQAVADADIVISVNHFKGHEQAGFGGALKNLGMGCASIAGKLELHSSSQPKINSDKCIGCKICEKNCNHGAVKVNAERKAVIDYDICVGCGQCVALCQYEGAVLADWDTSEVLNYKIAEYTKAVIKDKPNFHISLVMNVSPECDCWGHNDIAIVPDLGMMASFDPVALDQACADMVNKTPMINGWQKCAENFQTANAEANNSDCGCHEHENHSDCGCHDHENHSDCGCGGNHNHSESYCKHPGTDNFKMIHPDTDWKAGLRYAEELGIGSREYELVEV